MSPQPYLYFHNNAVTCPCKTVTYHCKASWWFGAFATHPPTICQFHSAKEKYRKCTEQAHGPRKHRGVNCWQKDSETSTDQNHKTFVHQSAWHSSKTAAKPTDKSIHTSFLDSGDDFHCFPAASSQWWQFTISVSVHPLAPAWCTPSAHLFYWFSLFPRMLFRDLPARSMNSLHSSVMLSKWSTRFSSQEYLLQVQYRTALMDDLSLLFL